jgi:hypothetical protein
MSQTAAYGLWTLVVINSLVFLVFAFSFTRPRAARDWMCRDTRLALEANMMAGA